MDGSGRFNFWRVLIYTRAITPPRVVRGLLLQKTPWRWWGAFTLACLGIGVVVQLGLGNPPSSREADDNSTLKPAAVQTASPKPPW